MYLSEPPNKSHLLNISYLTLQKQTKKETVTKSRKTKKSDSEDGGPKIHTAAVSDSPVSDSDSDSSLDVDKWRKLVSQLSGGI